VKIAVFHTGPLFAHDEAYLYATKLCQTLRELGHSAELTTFPFSPAVADVILQSTAYRLLDLRHGMDMCIGVGPFTHALKHDNKRVWLLSHLSSFYELWNTPYGAVTASHTNVATREYVHAVDREWLSEARLVCAGSQGLAHAVSQHCGVESRLLPPALPDQFLSRHAGYGDYVLAASPLIDAYRIPFIVEAFSRTKTPVRLVILGFECAIEEREYVEQTIAASGKADAITFEVNPSYTRFCECLSSALAFISVPFRTMVIDVFSTAAGLARKTILTTSDSGELARSINDGDDGYVIDPDTVALAHAMDRVMSDRKKSEQFGSRLFEKLRGALPSWKVIAEELIK
jgi:glycosyltransferase involved in cell wall biosynthesis